MRRNWIENDTPSDKTIGIFCGTGGPHVAEGNAIRGFKHGIQGGGTSGSQLTARLNRVWMPGGLTGSVGIHCDYGSLEKNLVVGYETPFRIEGPAQQVDNEVCAP